MHRMMLDTQQILQSTDEMIASPIKDHIPF